MLDSPGMAAALERVTEAGGAAGRVRTMLLQAIFAYVRDVGTDRVDIDALADALAEAAAPYRTEGEIAGYGIANLIAWAMERAPSGALPKPHYPAQGLEAKEASMVLHREMAKAVGAAAGWSAIATSGSTGVAVISTRMARRRLLGSRLARALAKPAKRFSKSAQSRVSQT